MARARRSKARAVAAASVVVVVLIFQQGMCYSPLRVYHYTNKAGYDGIVRSAAIRPSEIKQGDAYYGIGVYCTKLDPSTPIFQVLTNNYGLDGGFRNRGADKMDRADYVFSFELDLDKENVTVVNDTEERSVLIIGGGRDVSLKAALDFDEAQVVSDYEQADQELEHRLGSHTRHWTFFRVVSQVLLRKDSSLSLSFLHMGKLDFERYIRLPCSELRGATPEQLAAKFSWVERTDAWAGSAEDSLAFDNSSALDFVGYEYAVMVAWNHDENGEKTWVTDLHGPIADIGPWMATRREQWSKFKSPEQGRVASPGLVAHHILDRACRVHVFIR